MMAHHLYDLMKANERNNYFLDKDKCNQMGNNAKEYLKLQKRKKITEHKDGYIKVNNKSFPTANMNSKNNEDFHTIKITLDEMIT